MNQPPGIVLRERVITLCLGSAGLAVFSLSIVDIQLSDLNIIQALLTVLLTGTVILADQYPIHLGRGTKSSMTSLPIYLGVALLPAPLAIFIGGSGMLFSSLMARAERGLLPRDIISTTGQWMIIAFLGHRINHLTLPVLDLQTARFILLCTSAFAFLITDFTIFSLRNSFVLQEPFSRTFKATLLEGYDIEGLQLLVAILGALAIKESYWALPLLIIPAITGYNTIKNIKEVKYETLNLLEDMADTVDLRDIYTGGHSRRVADLVRQILIQMNISGPEAALIETAARLHDIGKIGIPDNILQKPGKLSPEETAIMQTHSEKGANLISKYKDFSRGALMIRHHHESWNGHGYPAHLKAYDIPFGSRVIAIADSFDAMTSTRPYRQALSANSAMQILLEGRGKQWDYNVVDAFVMTMTSQLNDKTSTNLSESELALALANTISTPSQA